jgi:hypothetical protein
LIEQPIFILARPAKQAFRGGCVINSASGGNQRGDCGRKSRRRASSGGDSWPPRGPRSPKREAAHAVDLLQLRGDCHEHIFRHAAA